MTTLLIIAEYFTIIECDLKRAPGLWCWYLLAVISTFSKYEIYRYQEQPDKLLFLQLIFNVILFILHFIPEPVSTKNLANESPEMYTSYPSVIAFSWLSTLINKGYKQALEENDLWDLLTTDKAEVVDQKFMKNWQEEIDKYPDCFTMKELESPTPSLVKAILKTHWKVLLSALIFKLLQSILLFIPSKVVEYFLTFMRSTKVPLEIGFFYATVMFIGGLSISVAQGQYFHRVYRVGMLIRSSLSAALYHKALRLSAKARTQSNQGEVIALLSADIQKLQDCCLVVLQLFTAPIQIFLSLFLLYQQLGWSMLGGLLAVAFTVLGAGKIQKGLVEATKRTMKQKSLRLKFTQELFNAIKIFKLYAWEDTFLKKIINSRSQELKALWAKRKYFAALSVLFSSGTLSIAVFTFSTYILTGTEKNPHILDSKKIFVSLTLFEILRFPMMMLPQSMVSIASAMVSVKRLLKFLLLPEVDGSIVEELNKDSENSVVFDQVSIGWEADKSTLSNINMIIPNGELVAVIGQTGAGKSTFVQSILGETFKTKGTIKSKKSIAYVPQQAWIQNETVRENIIFKKPLDRLKYNKVIQACALKDDLTQLSAGDKTEIGEKGINLSGGQKQRVSIARAVYTDADLYIFDDPLSAVDAHVGQHIFDKVLSNQAGYLRNKTRIFVTNAMHFVSCCDRVVILDEGIVVAQGTYAELVENKIAMKYFNEFNVTDVCEVAEEETPDYEKQFSKQRSRLLTEKSEKDTLIEKEYIQQGGIDKEIFKGYLKKCTTQLIVYSILTQLLYGFVQLSNNLWLKNWSNEGDSNANVSKSEGLTNLGGYVGIAIGEMLFSFIRSITAARAGYVACKVIHYDLLKNVAKAPMSFFDTTPLGRLLNRFSKDSDVIDDCLPMTVQFWMTVGSAIIFTICIIATVMPLFLLTAVPLAVIYFYVQRYFIATSRQLKRLENVSRSPIYNKFGEMLNGISTIRAFQNQSEFIAENG